MLRTCTHKNPYTQGRIQDFHLGGGAKDYVRAQNELTFGRGGGGLEALGLL